MSFFTTMLKISLVAFVTVASLAIGTLILLAGSAIMWSTKERGMGVKKPAKQNSEAIGKSRLNVFYSADEDGSLWSVFCDGHVDQNGITNKEIIIALMDAGLPSEDIREIMNEMSFEHSYICTDESLDSDDYPWRRCKADHPKARPVTAWWP